MKIKLLSAALFVLLWMVQSFQKAILNRQCKSKTAVSLREQDDDEFENEFMDGIDDKLKQRFPIKQSDSEYQRRDKRRAVFSGLKNREGLNRAVAAGLFIAGIGAGESR